MEASIVVDFVILATPLVLSCNPVGIRLRHPPLHDSPSPGFYSWYWVYKTEEEMGKHTGEGLGGVLGLVIWILISPVMGFVIPSEVGKMYQKDGQEPPMSGWTGLWLFPGAILIIPAIVWFVKVQGALNRYWEGKGATA